MKVKHKFLNVLLAVCMVLCMVPAPAFAADNVSVPATVWTADVADSFAGGTGAEADPYLIATAKQLAKLSKDVSNGTTYEGKFFKLTDNIDLSSHRWVPIGIYKWESSGSVENKSFQGFIDGNNMTISGLIVDERIDKNAAGFFGNILNMYGGTVGARNLTISNANIYAAEGGLESLQAGILVGSATANEGYQVVFENITVSGAVEIESTDGSNNVGGMIGYGSRVKAKDCKAENISITGASNSGGFIGLDVGSVYENCEVSGTVSGLWALGGFVGYTSTATLYDSSTQSVYKKCAADVEITGSDWRLGGFAGYAEYGQFDNCVAFGNITSTVTGWEPKVGGFIGQSDNAIANGCYAVGKVTSSTSVYKSAGGFLGCYFGGTFTDCSFDSDKNSGLTASGVDESWGSSILSGGVKGVNSNDVLANICADYYGGHNYSTEWTIDVEATTTSEGSKSHHCSVCDEKSDITPIPKLEISDGGGSESGDSNNSGSTDDNESSNSGGSSDNSGSTGDNESSNSGGSSDNSGSTGGNESSNSGGSSDNSGSTGSNESSNFGNATSEVTTGKDSASEVTTTTSPTNVKVENGTASAIVKAENVTEAIKQAADNKSTEIVFSVSEKDTGNADNIQLTISKSDAQQVLDKTDADLVVATTAGDVILPQEALQEAVSAAGGNDITIEIDKVTTPTAVQKEAAGENSYIVEVTIESQNKAITTFGGNSLKIRLEVPAALVGKDVAVIHIAEDGKTEKMPGKIVTEGTKQYYEFTTTHLSTFALVDSSIIEEETPTVTAPKKGNLLTDSKTKMVYKVTKSGTTGGTVQFVKTKNTKAKTVAIPDKVTIDGITYKVTSIAANALKNHKAVTTVTIGKYVTSIGSGAFKGCSKLKSINLNTTLLTTKTVSEKAFSGVSTSAVIKVPKSKLESYEKLFVKKGLSKKVKVKKK